ncbi:hypothetical protein C2I36_13770 [Rhodobacteraceae bacterium WD3A24]|nr:hypothetical protein C2I36_13770 [Rhodobacteraceae bacterium WD3A24]
MSALPDPEIEPEFYADIPVKRFVAWVFDSVLLLFISLLIVVFTLFTALFFLPVVFIALNLLYRGLTIARHSATPGMRLMAIEFRDRDGRRFGPVTAFLHTAGFVAASAFFVPQIVSIVLMLTTPRRQGLVDLVLGSVAINRVAERF